jgi:hypothetical protein
VEARKYLLRGALLVELVVHLKELAVLALLEHPARGLGGQVLAVDAHATVVEVAAPNDVVELLREVEFALSQLRAQRLAELAVLRPALLILVRLEVARDERERAAADGQRHRHATLAVDRGERAVRAAQHLDLSHAKENRHASAHENTAGKSSKWSANLRR